MRVEYSWLIQLLSVTSLVASPTQAAAPLSTRSNTNASYRTIAGVTVIDTPTVRAAHDLARQYSSDYLYKHVMRGWLFGALVLAHNETLAATVDEEVHAVAALLHDLGVAEGSPFISADRRFEVDGAIAARDFLRSHGGDGWRGSGGTGEGEDDAAARRIQLVWDAIALHPQPSIARYKEPVVAVTSAGITMEFFGTGYGVTQAEVDAVVAAYPKDDLLPGFNASLLWLAENKPATTYDTWQQPWGDSFVANYSAVGNRVFDVIAVIHSEMLKST